MDDKAPHWWRTERTVIRIQPVVSNKEKSEQPPIRCDRISHLSISTACVALLRDELVLQL